MTELTELIVDGISFIKNSILDLSEVNIPNLINASFRSTPITEAILPKSCNEISDSIFDSCTLLSKITIPAEVKTIPPHSFAYCSSLQQLMIADVYILNNHVFDLTKTNIELIGSDAFNQIGSITKIIIPNRNIIIEADSFGNNDKLDTVEFANSKLPCTLR